MRKSKQFTPSPVQGLEDRLVPSTMSLRGRVVPAQVGHSWVVPPQSAINQMNENVHQAYTRYLRNLNAQAARTQAAVDAGRISEEQGLQSMRRFIFNRTNVLSQQFSNFGRILPFGQFELSPVLSQVAFDYRDTLLAQPNLAQMNTLIGLENTRELFSTSRAIIEDYAHFGPFNV